MSYRPPIEPLTSTESNFASENHDVVLRFLSLYKLDYHEYYDVIILRYLRVCKRYCNEEELRKYKFTTIAFRALSSAVHNYRCSQQRKYALSLDDVCFDEGNTTFGELLPDKKADVLQTVIDRETIREYMTGKKVNI